VLLETDHFISICTIVFCPVLFLSLILQIITGGYQFQFILCHTLFFFYHWQEIWKQVKFKNHPNSVNSTRDPKEVKDYIPSTKPLIANCRSKLSSFYIEVLQLGFWNLNKLLGTKTMFCFVIYVICPSSTILLFWNKNIPGVNCIDRKVYVYEFHLLWETKPMCI